VPGVSDALLLEIFGPNASFDSDLPDDATDFSNSDCDLEADPNLDEKVVLPICHGVEVNGEKVNVSYEEGSSVSWIAESLVEKLGLGVKA
jgi:hypothetical protein